MALMISILFSILCIKYSIEQKFNIFDSITISGHKFYWANNCEFKYVGPPIILTNNYNLRIPTIDECALKCTEYSECTHFSLYKDDDGCFLYSGVFRYVNDAKENTNNQCGILVDRTSTHVVETRFGSNNFGIEIINKCDFDNQDLNSFTTENIWECGEKCSEILECTHFNYLTSEKKCITKEGIRSEKDVKYNQNSNCGILKSKMLRRLIVSKYGWRYNWERYCDFSGQDLDSVQAINFQECVDKCNEYDIKCTHFSFSKETNKCYLKYGERKVSDYLVKFDTDCGMLEMKRWPQLF